MPKSILTSGLSTIALMAAVAVAPACSAQVESDTAVETAVETSSETTYEAPSKINADWNEPPVLEDAAEEAPEGVVPMEEGQADTETSESALDVDIETALAPTLEVEGLLTFGTHVKTASNKDVGSVASLQRDNEGVVTTIIIEDKTTQIPVSTLSAKGEVLVTSMTDSEIK